MSRALGDFKQQLMESCSMERKALLQATVMTYKGERVD